MTCLTISLTVQDSPVWLYNRTPQRGWTIHPCPTNIQFITQARTSISLSSIQTNMTTSTMLRTQVRLFHTTRLSLASKLSSGNRSHAVDPHTQSVVPESVQRKAPKGLEEALPDSVRSYTYSFPPRSIMQA